MRFCTRVHASCARAHVRVPVHFHSSASFPRFLRCENNGIGVWRRGYLAHTWETRERYYTSSFPLSMCYTRASTAACGTSGRTFKAGQSTLRKRNLFVRYTRCAVSYDWPKNPDNDSLCATKLCSCENKQALIIWWRKTRPVNFIIILKILLNFLHSNIFYSPKISLLAIYPVKRKSF